MQPRISLRIGAACAIVGAAGIFAGNFLHPFPPAGADAMLALIAAEPHWTAIHFPTLFFATAILIGLVALADSIEEAPAASLAAMGRVVAQAGVSVMLVAVAVDGFAFKVLADGWAAAAPEERALRALVFDAVVLAETALVHTWVTFFLGVAFLLFGAALASGSTYPRALGWVGVLGGAGCVFSGAVGFLRLPITAPFPVFGTVILAWTFAAGVLMARRGAALAGRPSPAPRDTDDAAHPVAPAAPAPR